MSNPRALLAYALSCLIASAVLPSMALATQDCGGEPGWADAAFAGVVQSAELFEFQTPAFRFSLVPTDHGWRVQMFDADGTGLPVFAAPIRPVETNPLNIAGWHFRNRDNTAPNTGDVNAPQHHRRFAFGTLAAYPETGPELSAPGVTAEGLGGLGELVVSAFRLTPPERGTRAAFVSLEFSVCLVWQGGGDRLDPIAVADPGIAYATVVSAMIGCGLDLALYELSDRMSHGREGGQNPWLEPDMDGDNIPDLVVPVTRRSDQAPGLAICLLGDETMVLAGYAGRIGRHLDPVYFGRADFWAVHEGPVYQGAEEGAPPVLTGEAILLGKEEASSVLFYLDRNLAPSSYWQGD